MYSALSTWRTITVYWAVMIVLIIASLSLPTQVAKAAAETESRDPETREIVKLREDVRAELRTLNEKFATAKEAEDTAAIDQSIDLIKQAKINLEIGIVEVRLKYARLEGRTEQAEILAGNLAAMKKQRMGEEPRYQGGK